jgi:hypothetical protein
MALNSISYGEFIEGLGQVFAAVAGNVAQNGYTHFAILPRAELEISEGSKLRLNIPVAEKTQIDVRNVSRDFVLSSIGVNISNISPVQNSFQKNGVQFAAFKTADERDAFVDLVKGMDFFNDEKVYVIPYEIDGRAHDMAARSTTSLYQSYNPRAFM